MEAPAAADGDELQEAGSERVLFEAGSGEEMSFTVSPSGEMVAIIVTAASRSPPSWLCSWLLIACPPLSSVDLHVTCLAGHSALPRSPALHHPPTQTLLSRNPRPHPCPAYPYSPLSSCIVYMLEASALAALRLSSWSSQARAAPGRSRDHAADAACTSSAFPLALRVPPNRHGGNRPSPPVPPGPSLLRSSQSISLSRPRCTAVPLVW